jgi:type 1 fimbriae regulatory protein FimB/type 1 fimbriae regulatory protein FimE
LISVRISTIIRTVDLQGELIVRGESHLRLVEPTTENRTVTPRRRPNAELRTREYLTEAEVAKLIGAAKGNRYGQRDATMMLVAYRHGLRVSELVHLRWDQIDFDTANLAVRRVKKGSPSTHRILGDEMRALRRLHREQDPKSAFMFTSERGSPFTTAGFAKLVERAGEAAGFKFKAHPHMLRHRAGSSWPTMATIRGRCRLISDTRTFSTRSATASLRRIVSRTSGVGDSADVGRVDLDLARLGPVHTRPGR